MNLLEDLKIGEKLEIEPIRSKRNTAANHIITSQLVDKKDQNLYISSPIKKGISYPLFQGQQINIIFYRDEKGIYSFLGEVVQKLNIRFPIYIIKPLSFREKIQRRFYYRLQVLTKVAIRRLKEDSWLEGLTKDLSGGGLKLIVNQAFKIGEKVECIIILDKNQEVNVVGEIVRSVRDIVTNEYEVGIRYVDISEKTRNDIIAFIFKKQRELRQKGLI